MPDVRVRLKAALAAAGAVPGGARVLSRVGTPPVRPFAEARVIEGAVLAAHAVETPAAPDGPVGFVDGIQRYAVVGHVGVTPIVRAVVSAAAVERVSGHLRVVVTDRRDFLAVPAGRLTAAQRDALAVAGLPVLEADAGPRAHPLGDLVHAGERVETAREACERAVARRYLEARSDGYLLVDGALGELAEVGGTRVVGLIKSHETQFLEGRDLEVALTLAGGERSSVFRRTARGTVDTWYLRLWPWAERDLLHGLVRIEVPAGAAPAATADTISRWLLAERAPIARDARWDRLLYPIHEIETLLGAQLGGWP